MNDIPQGDSQPDPTTGEPGANPDSLEDLIAEVEPADADPEQASDDSARGDDDSTPDAPVVAPDDALIKLPDGSTITAKEAAEGVMLKRDYTQKRMAESEAVRSVQQQAAQAVAQQHAQVSRYLEAVATSLDDLVGLPTDQQIMEMIGQDPVEAQRMQMRRQLVMQQKGRLLQAAQAAAAEAETTLSRAQQEQLAAEAQKMAGFDWLTDATKTEMKGYLAKHGVPDITFAGLAEITRKAMAFDRQQAQIKTGKVAPKPSTLATAARPAQKVQAQAKQMQNLERAAHGGDKRAQGAYLSKLLG